MAISMTLKMTSLRWMVVSLWQKSPPKSICELQREKLKDLTFQDTWKCDPAKVFRQKKCLKGNEIRRDQGKSIFAMLREAEKWWEGRRRGDD